VSGFGAVILRTLGGWGQRVVTVLGLALCVARPAAAHDIPASVLLRVFIRPDGHTLRVLIRAPLESMRDINFPMRDSGRYLDIPGATALLPDATVTWITNAVRLFENDSLLATSRIVASRISLPSDESFASYSAASAHLTAPPLGAGVDLPWRQAMLDVEIEYPIHSDRSTFSIDPALARLGVRTTTVLRFLPAQGSERALEYVGDPGLVRLDPHWYQAAASFVRLGIVHIASGIDHLLFIFCLVIPFRRIRPLIGVVTAFTVAHSITLIASALGLAPGGLWFPPLIEVLIAASIVYMALENIVIFAGNGDRKQLDRRWKIAFAFGLVHGFGFSFALRESLQFAGSHLITSLLSFNVGVEIGQLALLLLAIPALNLLFQRVVTEKLGTIILSAFVSHTAWHWLTDRWTVFRQYHIEFTADRDVVLRIVFFLAMMATLFLVPNHKAEPVVEVER
jgi:hypothetical protein